MTSFLEAGPFVSGIVESATAVKLLLPVLLFAVAIGLSFATGTSWGTFGILIPIVTSVFSKQLADVGSSGEIPSMVIICISACLAGAVCGDHCSPISDTTIMASTGAQCDHVNHVSTQLPYAFTVAGVCAIGYLIAGIVQHFFEMSNTFLNVIVTGVSIVIMLGILLVIKKAGSQEPEPVATAASKSPVTVKKTEMLNKAAAKPQNNSAKKKTANNKKKKKR